MSLDIAAPDLLTGFLEDVITRFKVERLTGPPDTHFMLITLLGALSPTSFAAAFRAATAHDAPARALLGALHRADVLHGDPEAFRSGHASLLA